MTGAERAGRTGFAFHERTMWQDTRRGVGPLPTSGGYVEPGEPAEHVNTKRRIRSLFEVSGILDGLTAIRPRPAEVEDLLRFHERDYVERVRQMAAAGGGDAGGYTPIGGDGFEIARLSAGSTIAATEAVLDGSVTNAFSLSRPPGHHALAGTGMGFCVFNNIVVAVRRAQALGRVERVAVVDWDVHHGNGTESAFYDDPSVLTISVHQDNNFPPDSGAIERTGEGAGRGFNLNVPLPAGSGVATHVRAFERVVVPALTEFAPELIVIASGLDAHAFDPMGRQLMHSDGYRELTRMVMEVAGESCAGRIVVSHEGGYNPAAVPFSALAVLETLCASRTDVEDPFMPLVSGSGGQAVEAHQIAMIDAAAANLPLSGAQARQAATLGPRDD